MSSSQPYVIHLTRRQADKRMGADRANDLIRFDRRENDSEAVASSANVNVPKLQVRYVARPSHKDPGQRQVDPWEYVLPERESSSLSLSPTTVVLFALIFVME